MKIKTKSFRVSEDEDVVLKKRPTRIDSLTGSTDDYKALLQNHVERMSELQQLLYASDKYALLLIFQAMDAAGKDGAIKHVMSGRQPAGLPGVQLQAPERRSNSSTTSCGAPRAICRSAGGSASSIAPTTRRC